MKKVLIVSSIFVLFVGLYAESPVGIGLGARYNITTAQNADDYFSLEANALIHVYENFYARFGVVNLSFISSKTYVNFGTGVPVGNICASPGIDILMLFNAPKTVPYAVGGFSLATRAGHTDLNFRLGGGAEFIIGNGPTRPYAEVTVDINRSSNAVTSTENVISLKGGIRIK